MIWKKFVIYTIQLGEGAEEFDTHAYAKKEYKSTTQFAEKLRFYQQKYLTQIGVQPGEA